MTLPNIIDEIVATVKSIPLLGDAYDSPVDQINGPWPVIVAYPDGGTIRLETTRSDHNRPSTFAVHTITVSLHWPRKELRYDIARLLGFADTIPEALMASFIRDRFGGTVVALGDARSPGASGAIRYEFGDGEWGGIQTLAFRFSFDVTAQAAIEEAIP